MPKLREAPLFATTAGKPGRYTPLSRPLFVYPSQEALRRPEIEAFIRFDLEREREIAEGALFVPLTEGQFAGGEPEARATAVGTALTPTTVAA